MRPIARDTLSAKVAEQIRDDIRRGAFPPGAQLNELALAERLGVSRGPVREGLQRLIQEGLLRSQPHRGVFVPVVSEADILDIYYAREVIEAAAARRIMNGQRPPDLLPALEAIVDEMAQAVERGDWPAMGQLDMRFHGAVVDAAGSARLSRMFATVLAETQLCLSMLTDLERAREDLLDEHRQLAQLLMGADVDTTLKTLHVHFAEAVESLRNRLRRRSS